MSSYGEKAPYGQEVYHEGDCKKKEGDRFAHYRKDEAQVSSQLAQKEVLAGR